MKIAIKNLISAGKIITDNNPEFMVTLKQIINKAKEIQYDHMPNTRNIQTGKNEYNPVVADMLKIDMEATIQHLIENLKVLDGKLSEFAKQDKKFIKSFFPYTIEQTIDILESVLREDAKRIMDSQ